MKTKIMYLATMLCITIVMQAKTVSFQTGNPTSDSSQIAIIINVAEPIGAFGPGINDLVGRNYKTLWVQIISESGEGITLESNVSKLCPDIERSLIKTVPFTDFELNIFAIASKFVDEESILLKYDHIYKEVKMLLDSTTLPEKFFIAIDTDPEYGSLIRFIGYKGVYYTPPIVQEDLMRFYLSLFRAKKPENLEYKDISIPTHASYKKIYDFFLSGVPVN